MKAMTTTNSPAFLKRALSLRTSLTPVKSDDPRLAWAAVFAATVVVASLLFLAWVRSAEVRAGYALHDLRGEVLQKRHERQELTLEVQTLKRPERLDALAREKLSLFPPTPRRTVPLESAMTDSLTATATALVGALP